MGQEDRGRGDIGGDGHGHVVGMAGGHGGGGGEDVVCERSRRQGGGQLTLKLHEGLLMVVGYCFSN